MLTNEINSDKENIGLNGSENAINQEKQPFDYNTAFLRSARAGNLQKVLGFLDLSGIDINTCNSNGLNALHLASKEGHAKVVQELLKRNCVVDACTKKGNTALHIACLAGHIEIVKLLVAAGANVNAQSTSGFTPLYMAAQENHEDVVRFLLEKGANQSLATQDGFTPVAVAMQQEHDKIVALLLENDPKAKIRLPALHIAAKKDDVKAALLLLQNDNFPDITSKSGFTPLHIAAHYGNTTVANILYQKGADINYQAKHNISPLHVAAKWGKLDMVIFLVEKGANIEAKTRDSLTPLHCAARSGHQQVVEYLVQNKASLCSKTKNGLVPLHMAAQGDHVDAAQVLLRHGAAVDEITVDYLTALHVAAHCGHVAAAKLLLDHKGDSNARALNGFTPLHIACKKNRIKVVELLLKYGASLEATTESGLTPLHVASFMGCMNIVIYLLQHGANPDAPTVRGETPLHLATRANHVDIIRVLLRNGANVNCKAGEDSTPLHIASRVGNSDIVMLLIQHGASINAHTKDLYTPLHIAAKEDQEEVALTLLEYDASVTAVTKKGFTPLHLASKYGNLDIVRLLLQKEDTNINAQAKNGTTPLHLACYYEKQKVVLYLLSKGAPQNVTAKNGHTPLHIAARKNKMDIATALVEYSEGVNIDAESKAGFTPLHLASQLGHLEMCNLLITSGANTNHRAKNGLTPMHLCAQEDKVNVAVLLETHGASIDPVTKGGFTPLHVASHYGHINMVRFLLQRGANINSVTDSGYTSLHQAAQQGHTLIITLLLHHKADPNVLTSHNQTAMDIAQKLGYISIAETLKIVTETTITTTTVTTIEEKYRVIAPEGMQEVFISDSEDEGGEDSMVSDHHQYRYMTNEDMKSFSGDDSFKIDVTRDERFDSKLMSLYAPITKSEYSMNQSVISSMSDNVDLAKSPALQTGFLVSFIVDARGSAMRGCRHSGVRVIIPPRKASSPMRVTCRYLRKEKLVYPPPLMEGEALASRILELSPAGAKFLGPVIIEVPHFASLRGKERELIVLRCENGIVWKEHILESNEEAVQAVLNESFPGEDLRQLEDLHTSRIVRILTTDFPQYFAIVSRFRQEIHTIGTEGGVISSTAVPQVQALFPANALTKRIKVGLQAQPISNDIVTRLSGNSVAVSPIVTIEPRRRKFHKSITLTIPLPQAANKGMINQYSGDAPTLRLLCSITGGSAKALWEDVTGSTPLTFVKDCVSFTTTVSARFWLIDCRDINQVTHKATEIYNEANLVPFMVKFVVFAKKQDEQQAQLRIFCMTDDKEDKTLEHQEHFIEVAKSRDVEVLENIPLYIEIAGNLVPVMKCSSQLQMTFQAFKENRLPFAVRLRHLEDTPSSKIVFLKYPKISGKSDALQRAIICMLNITLPQNDYNTFGSQQLDIATKCTLLKNADDIETIHRADIRLSDICSSLTNGEWKLLANELGVLQSDVDLVEKEYPNNTFQQAMIVLKLWLQTCPNNCATGNALQTALRNIGREDVVKKCTYNIEQVTDAEEKESAKLYLDQIPSEKQNDEELSKISFSDPVTDSYEASTLTVISNSSTLSDNVTELALDNPDTEWERKELIIDDALKKDDEPYKNNAKTDKMKTVQIEVKPHKEMEIEDKPDTEFEMLVARLDKEIVALDDTKGMKKDKLDNIKIDENNEKKIHIKIEEKVDKQHEEPEKADKPKNDIKHEGSPNEMKNSIGIINSNGWENFKPRMGETKEWDFTKQEKESYHKNTDCSPVGTMSQQESVVMIQNLPDAWINKQKNSDSDRDTMTE